MSDIVDLRSGIDQTYNQGPENSCKAYSLQSAMECMFDRSGDPNWVGKRVSAKFMHNIGRYNAGTINTESGLTDWHISDSLRRYGFCLEQDYPEYTSIYEVPGIAAQIKAQAVAPVFYEMIPYVDDDPWKSLVRSIDFGVPIVITVNMTQGLQDSTGVWHDMNHDGSASTLYEHSMTVVGYHRTKKVALAENSWGPGWGDGGFCGIPADKFNQGPQRCVTHMWRLEKIPVRPVKVDGFMPGIPKLTPSQSRDFTTLVGPTIKNMLIAAFTAGGTLGLRDKCIELGVSDVLAEELLELQRGEAQGWFESQNVPQGAMIWYPLV